jgi:hypothetical protein
MIQYYNMNFIDYNIDYSFISSKPFIITAILLFIIFFIMFVICSYFVLNFLKISIEYNNVFFYQYNKKCQKIINEYGNCKINKIYLVRQPFGKLVNLVFNILTLFNYNKYLSESEDNYPYHPALIFEIKKDNKIKYSNVLTSKN